MVEEASSSGVVSNMPLAKDAMRPSTAEAATVRGEARYRLPGPLRPWKLRLMALTVT